jgi:hypothetical protein
MNSPTSRSSRLNTAVRTAFVAAGAVAVAVIGGGVAQAAAGRPAALPTPPTSGPLHIEADIPLGEANPHPPYPVAFTEAPDGAVYYGNGSAVDVVVSTGAPKVAEHVSGRPLALAASSTDLYVLINRTVTDYSRSTGRSVGSWALPSSLGTPGIAGMFARTGVVWVWTQVPSSQQITYAAITALTPGWKVKVVETKADPYYLDSDEQGNIYYYSPLGRIVRANALGAKVVSPDPMSTPFGFAISDGRLCVITSPANTTLWSTWDLTHLQRFGLTIKLHNMFGDIYANTGAGLIGWVSNGSSLPGPQQVGRVGVSSGAVSDTVTVTGAEIVLEGYYPALISVENGQFHLVRLD